MEFSKIDGKFDEMSHQLVIAMSGDREKRSEIAFKLAQFLKCSLIDAADIIDNEEEYDSSSSSSRRKIDAADIFDNEENDSFFSSFSRRKIEASTMKAVRKISITQLKLKLNVIINNLILSRHSHAEDLVRLATYEGAHLLFIQCAKAQSEKEKQKEAAADDGEDNDYDAFNEYYMSLFGKSVPKLSIDTTKPFVVEEFLPTLLHIAADKESSSSSKSQQQIIQPSQRMITQGHAHEFIIMEDHHDQKLRYDTYCNKCIELISPFSGPAGYRCIVCEHFNLHKSCAESPIFYKLVKSSYKCRLCEKFTEFCNDCLLQTHIASGYLPTVICGDEKLASADTAHRGHQHLLSFVIMPLWVKYKYLCFGCNEMGECVSYKCFSCNLDFHIDCVLPDETFMDFSLFVSETKPIYSVRVNKALSEIVDGLLQYVYHVSCFMKKKRHSPRFEAQMKALFN